MNQRIKILHLEDLASDAELVARELTRAKINFEIKVVEKKADFIAAIKTFVPDIILSDHSLASFDSTEALKIVKQSGSKAPFILVTATVSEEFAVSIMKDGAQDYILKDRLQRLPSAIINSYEKYKLAEEKQNFIKNIIESEAMLKEAEKIAHFGSWETDLLTGISKWSDEAYRIFGVVPGSIQPSYSNFLKCVHPEDKSIVQQATEAAINNSETQKINYRVVNKDGSVKYIRSELVVERDKKKHSVRIIGFNHDITGIKRTENSLIKSEANLRSIFDHSDTGYILLDKQLTILSFNQLAFEWTGKDLKIQLHEGRNFLTQLHFKRMENIRIMMEEVLSGEQIEFESQAPFDETHTWYFIRLNPVKDVAGKIIGLCIAVSDISKRKQAEEAHQRAEEELKAAHERLLFHIENTPLGFIEWDNKLVVKSWSKRAEEIFGWKETDFIDNEKYGFNGVYEEDLPAASKMAEELLAGMVERNKIQHRNHTKDGNIIWCEWFNSVLKDKEGKVITIMSLVQDITERKNAEKQLKESELFNKGVLASLSSHLAVIDKDGFVIAVNKAWTDFAIENGVVCLERVSTGSNYFDVCKRAISEGDAVAAEALAGIMSVFKKEKHLFEMEYTCDSTNKHRWFSMSVMNFGTDDNKVVTSHIDITERKKAEELLRQSQSSTKAIIENTDASIYSLDTDFRFITFNKQLHTIMYESYGINIKPGDKVFGFLEKLDIEDARQWKEIYSKAFEGEIVKFERKFNFNDTTTYTSFSIHPIWENNKVIGLSCYVMDITNQKIDELNKAKMTADLIQRNKDLEQFAYIVSHNLRAPVANIIGISDALHNMELSGEEEMEMTGDLSRSVIKLDSVIKDLDHILQVKRGISEKKVVVKFSELLRDITLSIDGILKKEKVRFIIDFSEVDEMITLKSYLHSIFLNLISNSIKYKQLNSNPVIEIKSSKTANRTMLIFKDNGLGIDLKKRGGQVFGLYKRFHAHTEGKGMGLYMVKTQVETLGGKISIKSEVNKGTEISIEFEMQNYKG